MALSLLWPVISAWITCSIYKEYSATRYAHPDTKVLFEVLLWGPMNRPPEAFPLSGLFC